MKIKVNKHKLSIHYRGSPWGSRTRQHAYCLRYAHSHHIESHLGKKQPQARIEIAFLFGPLHFNNVTSHAVFYGGHFVMRSKKCAVQNQGITLTFQLFLLFCILERYWYIGPLLKYLATKRWVVRATFALKQQNFLAGTLTKLKLTFRIWSIVVLLKNSLFFLKKVLI